MMEGVSISFGDRKRLKTSKPENEEDAIRHIARLEYRKSKSTNHI